MNTFKVGQKVVCIDADNTQGVTNIPCQWGLRKDEIFTIREMVVIADLPLDIVNISAKYIDDPIGLRLEGIVREEPDVPYSSGRFRPLVEKPTKEEITAKVNLNFGHHLKEKEKELVYVIQDEEGPDH